MNVTSPLPPGASRTRMTDALGRGATSAIADLVLAARKVRSAARGVDQQLRDWLDDRQTQRPADERPTEVDGLEGTGQGGHASVLVIVTGGLEGEPIEIAQRVIRGGHDLQATGVLALEPPTELRTRATADIDVQEIGRTFARDVRTPAGPPDAHAAAIGEPVSAELGVHPGVFVPAGQAGAGEHVQQCGR